MVYFPGVGDACACLRASVIGLMVILLRRLLALLFFLLFTGLLLVVSLVMVVNGTLLESDFYKEQLRKADMYNFLYEDGLPLLVEENLERQQELPFGIDGDTDMIVAAVQRIAPPEWIQENVEQTIDQVVPYIAGDTDDFTITVSLKDRAEVAQEVLRDWLQDADTYSYILDDVLLPMVDENIGQFAQFPLGVTVTAGEIGEDLRKVITQEWVQLRVDEIFAEVGPYLVGDKEQFRLVVSLEDRIDAGIEVLAERADRKFQEVLGAVPECTAEQLSQLDVGSISRGEMPDCLPRGFTFEQAKELLGLNVGTVVREAIGDRLPTTWTFTEVDLQQSLRELSGDDAVEILDNVREALSEGFTYTEADVREQMAKAEDGQRTLDQLDTFRSRLDLGRQSLFLLYIPIALALGVIGFLGGRGWWGRLRWGSTALAAGSGVILAIVLTLMGQARDQLELNLEGTDLPEVVMEKLREVSSNLLDTFLGSLMGQVQIYLIVGLVVLAGSIVVPLLLRLRRGEQEI